MRLVSICRVHHTLQSLPRVLLLSLTLFSACAWPRTEYVDELSVRLLSGGTLAYGQVRSFDRDYGHPHFIHFGGGNPRYVIDIVGGGRFEDSSAPVLMEVDDEQTLWIVAKDMSVHRAREKGNFVVATLASFPRRLARLNVDVPASSCFDNAQFNLHASFWSLLEDPYFKPDRASEEAFVLAFRDRHFRDADSLRDCPALLLSEELDVASEVIREVLNDESDPSIRVHDDGYATSRLQYAATLAARERHPRILARLLTLGADANYIDFFDICPMLINAVQARSAEIVRVLLDHGAKIDARCTAGTALSVAIEHGHSEIVRLLLERGAAPVGIARARALEYRRIVEYLERRG